MFESLFARRGLSLDRLRVLLEVQDAGSIAHAVPGNPTRHSQYSRQLRELSEFFGVEMAERRGKFVKLTAHGARLAEVSREFFRALEDLAASCRGDYDVFTLSAGESLMQWLLLPRLGGLLRKLPHVKFVTESARTDDIIHRLSDLRTDFGMVRKNALVPGLKAADLGTLTYTAVVPRKLAPAAPRLKLADVFQLPVAIQTTDGQFGQQLLDIGAAEVPGFKPALACQSFPQTLAAVQSGHFAAILPNLAVSTFERDAVVTVSGPPLRQLRREIALVWNPRMIGIRPLAEQVAEALRVGMRFG